METKTLRMPCSYAAIEGDELCALSGGELTEENVKVLSAVISVFATSVILMPNVYQFMLTPVTTAIGNFFSNLFKKK